MWGRPAAGALVGQTNQPSTTSVVAVAVATAAVIQLHKGKYVRDHSRLEVQPTGRYFLNMMLGELQPITTLSSTPVAVAVSLEAGNGRWCLPRQCWLVQAARVAQLAVAANADA